MKSSGCLVAVLIMCLSSISWAASDRSVSISSSSLQLQEKQGDIRFEGNVEVRMSDIVLNCDLLTIRSDTAEPSKILSGKASGNVVLTKGADRVEATEADFDLEKGQVVLSGVPRLSREETIIEAEKIIYSIEEGTASFQGPVRALFKSPGE